MSELKRKTRIKLGRTQCIRWLAQQIRITEIKLKMLSGRCHSALLNGEAATLSMVADHCAKAAKSVDGFAHKHRDPRGARSKHE